MCLISFHPSAILYIFISKTRFPWCTWNVFPLRILHSFPFFLPSVSWFFHDFCLLWQVIVQCLVILGDPLIYLGQMSNWDQGFQCDCIETVTWGCVQRWSCHLLCLWLFFFHHKFSYVRAVPLGLVRFPRDLLNLLFGSHSGCSVVL